MSTFRPSEYKFNTRHERACNGVETIINIFGCEYTDEVIDFVNRDIKKIQKTLDWRKDKGRIKNSISTTYEYLEDLKVYKYIREHLSEIVNQLIADRRISPAFVEM